MNFAGINGERAEAIRDVLQREGQATSVGTIKADLERNGRQDLLPRYGQVEALQAVLREMERRGEVTRVARGVRHHMWSLL